MYEKYNELFSQAIHETLPSIGNGLYSCLPNDMGKAMERFDELCAEHGIDPITGETLAEPDWAKMTVRLPELPEQ